MSLVFLQTAVLLGLAGLAIPVLIHLWNRRRPDVVDWGAMQFLMLESARRRRLVLEELLLLATRLGLVALIVCGLAAPLARGPLVAAWTEPPRDVVYVLDASASMSRTDVSPTPWEHALDAIRNEIGALRPGDRWGLVLANRPVRPVGDELRRPADVDDVLAALSAPAGSADGPGAVALAEKLLAERGRAGRREVRVLTDGQQWGWADAASLRRWEVIARGRPADATSVVATVRPTAAPPTPRNYGVTALQGSRKVAVVGQRLRFLATVEASPDSLPPAKLRALVGEDVIGQWAGAEFWEQAAGRGQVRFEHTFRRAGPQHVHVVLDPPSESADAFAADQRRDVVVEVLPEFPVLLVDGAEEWSPESPAFFLAQAFSDPDTGARPSPVTPRRLPASRFDRQALASRPRVVVLADVPSLSAAQAEALDGYLREGGAVLVLLGPRVDADAYNGALYRSGKGWLPCRLDGQEKAQPGATATLDTARLLHPALALFEDRGKSPLARLTFRRWWRTTTDRHGGPTVAALFSNGDPWLIEKAVGAGRVLVSTVPLDRSWDNALATSWEFPVLAHELVYALADAGSGRFNLEAGQPVRVGPELFHPPWKPDSLPLAGVLRSPDDKTRPLLVTAWPSALEPPGPAGVYRIELGDRPAFPIVVEGDAHEADLTPLSASDRKRLADVVGIQWQTDASPTLTSEEGEADVWRAFFLAVIGFLCLEAWLARRIAAP